MSDRRDIMKMVVSELSMSELRMILYNCRSALLMVESVRTIEEHLQVKLCEIALAEVELRLEESEFKKVKV